MYLTSQIDRKLFFLLRASIVEIPSLTHAP
jgi:hypothetical protein